MGIEYMQHTQNRVVKMRSRVLDALEKMEPEKMDIKELAVYMSLISLYCTPYYGLGVAAELVKGEE